MLDIRKRTGYLFLTVMMAQVLLVSAQVQNKGGVRVLQAVTFELFSRVQFGTASGLNGVTERGDDLFERRASNHEFELRGEIVDEGAYLI